MELFPALMIGGPPHSGKSVLAYSLTQALRLRAISHYVLRAYPDGEGDWANEADQELVRRIRLRGSATRDWVARICRDIAARHLPLIVDVGGRPTAWQEAVFDHCTHALLLTRDADSRAEWHTLAARHSLPVLADLHSSLLGEDVVTDRDPVLRGQIGRLVRGRTACGPTFDALVELLAALFAYDEAELRTLHLSLAPAELVVELQRLGAALAPGAAWQRWVPEQLPGVLDYVPPRTALAVYDRGPNWLYAALALHAWPASFSQFDPRLGWIAPPEVSTRQAVPPSPLSSRLVDRDAYTWAELVVRDGHLDYGESQGIYLPPLPPGKGIVVSGRLPLWLWTAVARAYRSALWLAIFQPQLGTQAVVVASRVGQVRPGETMDARPIENLPQANDPREVVS